MRGEVIGFDPDTNTGAISGQYGSRYDFVRIDWRGAHRPARGTVVDFVVDGQRALDIYPAVTRRMPSEGETAQIVYILYLASLAVGITAIIGLVIAYLNRAEAPQWLKTHYRFQIRTFWIGLLFGFINLLTAFILIGLLGFLLLLIWWIVRCVKGLKYLAQGQPYENAATWLW